MNFDIIHLKFIEAPPIWLIMLLTITSIVFIAMITYAIPILFRKKKTNNINHNSNIFYNNTFNKSYC